MSTLMANLNIIDSTYCEITIYYDHFICIVCCVLILIKLQIRLIHDLPRE